MSRRFVYKVLIVFSVLSLLLAGCQAPSSQSASSQPEALIEQTKAEVRQQELARCV